MNSGEPKIPEETMAAALKLHADILGTQGCCDGVPEAVAFAWSEGHGAGRKSVYRAVERYADQADVDVISVQGLRHLDEVTP